MKWKLLAIVALLAGGGLAVASSLGTFGSNASAASTFLTAQAAVADVVDEVAATGTVASTTTYDLAFGAAATTTNAAALSSSSAASNGQGTSTVTWPVATVAVQVGDRVTKGQTLATASTADLQSQIDDAVRDYRTAEIQLAQAQTQLDDATATDAIRQARIGLYSAQTGDAHARTALATLRAQLAFATLAAPEAGIVTVVAIQAGADAPSGAAITIAGGTLEVTTSVVESDVASISTGQAATITVAALAGTTMDGTVTSIAPTGSAGSNGGVVSYAVEVALASPPDGLRAGMSADVTITTASATGVLAIPARALNGTAGAYRVRVLAADGTVTTRDVTVGLITSSLVEIKSGLQAGDVVITGTSTQQTTTNNRQGAGGTGAFPAGGGNFRVVNP